MENRQNESRTLKTGPSPEEDAHNQITHLLGHINFLGGDFVRHRRQLEIEKQKYGEINPGYIQYLKSDLRERERVLGATTQEVAQLIESLLPSTIVISGDLYDMTDRKHPETVTVEDEQLTFSGVDIRRSREAWNVPVPVLCFTDGTCQYEAMYPLISWSMPEEKV